MDQIPAEFIKACGRTIRSEIHNLLIIFEIRSNCPRSGMSRSFYLFIGRVIKQMVVIVEAYNFCQIRTKCYPTPNNFLREIIGGFIIVDFDSAGQLLTDHIFCIRQILEEKLEYDQAIRQLFVDFKKACDSVRREVLYNTLIEFGISMELVSIIKMCLNETCSRVRVFKHFSDIFPVNNGLKQGDALSSLLFNFVLDFAFRRVQVN
jgi:hypothetical protein